MTVRRSSFAAAILYEIIRGTIGTDVNLVTNTLGAIVA